MVQQTLTAKELETMVASMQSVEVELDAVDMQCAKAEYEHHEANWEELESDDSHQELYID